MILITLIYIFKEISDDGTSMHCVLLEMNWKMEHKTQSFTGQLLLTECIFISSPKVLPMEIKCISSVYLL